MFSIGFVLTKANTVFEYTNSTGNIPLCSRGFYLQRNTNLLYSSLQNMANLLKVYKGTNWALSVPPGSTITSQRLLKTSQLLKQVDTVTVGITKSKQNPFSFPQNTKIPSRSPNFLVSTFNCFFNLRTVLSCFSSCSIKSCKLKWENG